MLEYCDPDSLDEVNKMLSEPLRADDAPPRVLKESLRKIGFVPSWWVDDEEASQSSMSAAREMR